LLPILSTAQPPKLPIPRNTPRNQTSWLLFQRPWRLLGMYIYPALQSSTHVVVSPNKLGRNLVVSMLEADSRIVPAMTWTKRGWYFCDRYSKPEEYGIVTVDLPKLRSNDVLIVCSIVLNRKLVLANSFFRKSRLVVFVVCATMLIYGGDEG
jgi:hypothetical protein